jgi:DNA-binding XRE family transcriptional regulator
MFKPLLMYRPMTLPPDNPLARWRAVRGLSQAELAAIAGVHRNTVARTEMGKEPRVLTAIRLARALRCDVESIFTLDGSPSPELEAAERRRAT